MMLAKYFLKPSIVSRDEWKANSPTKETPELKQEVEHVVVTFTESTPCSNKQECIKRVKELQRKHVEEDKEPDISYNFLVGGDGNVYEGRGWKRAPKPYPESNKSFEPLHGNAIEVAFIGHSEVQPSLKMMKAFAGVVMKAMTDKVVVPSVKQLKPCVIMGDSVLYLRDQLMAKMDNKGDDEKKLDDKNKLKAVA